MFKSIWGDTRYCLRQFKNTPAFTATVWIILGTAIGLNAAVFSLVDSILYRSLPVKDPNQLVILHFDLGGWSNLEISSSGFSGYEFSYPLFEEFRNQRDAFLDVFGYAPLGFKKNLVLQTGEHALQASGTMVTGSFFQGLGVTPTLGRLIQGSDISDTSPKVVVISYSLWQKLFSKGSDIVGRNLSVNATTYTIIGVAAKGFTGIQPGIVDDLWIPITASERVSPWGIGGKSTSSISSERWWWLTVVGRLRPGISRERASLSLSAKFISSLKLLSNEAVPLARLPQITLEDGKRGIPMLAELYKSPTQVLMGLVMLVLLTACANLATLFLARASVRSREVGLRLALGAGRSRVWRQLITESLLLSLTGGVIGASVAPLAMRALSVGLTLRSNDLFSLQLALNQRVLAFTIATSVLAGFAFGIFPAIYISRTDVSSMLKGQTLNNQKDLLLRLLVVAQASISTVLVVSFGVFFHSLAVLHEQTTGFKPEHLLNFTLEPTQSGYDQAQLPAMLRLVQQRLKNTPGVQSATLIGNRLMTGWQNSFEIQVEGFNSPDQRDPTVLNNSGGPDFLQTAGIPVLSGRDFGETDTATAAKVAIVNRSFVAKYFGSRNPLGYHIVVKGGRGQPQSAYSIIGVCDDARYDSLRSEIAPTWYQSALQQESSSLKRSNFMVRASGRPESVIKAIEATLRGIDSRLIPLDIKTQSEQTEDSLGTERIFVQASGCLGVIAAFLAGIGLYGTLSYTVLNRQRELSTRLALGATPQQILTLILGKGLRLTIYGILIGWFLAWLCLHLLASVTAGILFRVDPSDPISFVGSGMGLIVIAIFASTVPARRAASTDPIRTLRVE